jgi:hypothetical protein
MQATGRLQRLVDHGLPFQGLRPAPLVFIVKG